MAQASGGWDAVVIGSGMGGLAAAALLARLHGRRVLVLERHWRAGGFTHTFERPGGFRWDVGLHYVGGMLEPGMPRDAMAVVTGGTVRWNPMPEGFDRLVFPGFEFTYRAGARNQRDDLVAAFPAERKAIDRWFSDVRKVQAVMALPILRSAAPRPVAAAVGWLLAGRERLALQTTGDWLAAHVRDPRLRAVLGARWGDHGLPPGQGAFLMQAVIAQHYLEGAAYPEGSAASLADGARRVIEAAGGEVRVRAEVARILVEGGRAVGVRLAAGEEVRAPVVISDAGARNTFLRLLGDEVPIPFRETLRAFPPSMAAVTLYLGLSRSPAELGVRGENFWLHQGLDHDAAWADRSGVLEGRVPQCYLSFPSMKDPAARAHTAELITSVDGAAFARWAGSAWKRRGAEYEAQKARIAEALLAAAEARLPGLRGLVVHQELSTPLSSEGFTAHPGGEILRAAGHAGAVPAALAPAAHARARALPDRRGCRRVGDRGRAHGRRGLHRRGRRRADLPGHQRRGAPAPGLVRHPGGDLDFRRLRARLDERS
ncbi:MAG: NAD(P)/FAD-dependent oxidoreductase [Anaeromyxobacter sp.]